jgi:tetratricopeptide (TPR) repeat protein
MLETAERLAPDLAETRWARGAFVLQVDQDADRALAEFEAALSVRPNAGEALDWLGAACIAKRDLDRAEVTFLRVEEIDPLRHFNGMDARQVCRAKREWDKARFLSQKYITRHPDDILGYLDDARQLVEGFGNLDEAQQVLTEGMRLPTPSYRFPGNPTMLKEFRARIARYRRDDSAAVRILRQNNVEIPPEFVSTVIPDRAQARRYLDSLRVVLEREASVNHWMMPELSMVKAALGLRKDAIACAEKAVDRVPKADVWMEREQHEENLLQVCVLMGEHARALDMIDDLLSRPGFLTTWKLRLDPVYDPLRGNPRFQALIARNERM